MPSEKLHNKNNNVNIRTAHVNIMRLVRVRKSCRGERILVIPKEIAKKIKAGYMNVQLDDAGRLTYTPVSISEVS